MDLMQWLTDTELGKLTFTMLVSMVPVIELRGGMPFGAVALGLSPAEALIASVIGNMIPIPFIVVYIRRILKWMRRRIPKLGRLVDTVERKAHLKGRTVTKYKYLGLFIFVAIPLPGTGAWTGSLIAALLGMKFKKAFPAVIIGICMATVIMWFISYVLLGGVHLLG